MTAGGYIKYLWSKGRMKGSNDRRIEARTRRMLLYKLLKKHKIVTS
jgi:hypothetical protein